MTPALAQLCRDARDRADDVGAQLRAAYECDGKGHETEAVVFYDAAWKLGVPAGERHAFLIGYGSTLKNVGRLAESEAVLRKLIAEDPESGAARAFLALTLQAAGRSSEAVGELLELAMVNQDRDASLKRYQRAITEYRRELSTR